VIIDLTPIRDGVEVVAMDGFTGFMTATSEELPGAVAVMDPLHVVRLAGDAPGHLPAHDRRLPRT
jgi:transposase